MEKQGYIKLHRKFLDWEWYSDMPTRCTFEFLLIKANHKAKLFKGKTIERGATLTSYREISEKNGMSLQNARTALKHLKSTGEVTCEKMLNGLYIKVLNYDLYQSDNILSNTQLTDDQHTTNIQLTTNKNDKECIKNVKNKTYIGIIQNYTDNEVLIEALKSYVDMRQKTKGFTTRALELNLNALNKLTNDIPTKIEIVNQSISNTWKSFYPLKNQKQSITQTFEQTEEKEMSDEELKEIMANINSLGGEI